MASLGLAMAKALPILVILLLGCCAISAMRAKTQEGVGSGSCPHGKGAWAVFQELTTLQNPIRVGQHSELLFCYLSHDKRISLGLPEDVAGDHPMERTTWLNEPHWCYGVAYGSGISIYEKRLSEPRMKGAAGRCADTQKYFKGCVGEWHTALVEEVARVPSYDEGGWWLLQMIHAFNTCQPTWTADKYIGLPWTGGVAHNCNGFAQTLLACSLKLSGDLHLSSPKISNRGFEHTCACAETIDVTGVHKVLQINRKVDIFQACEEGWSFSMVFFSSSDSSSSSSQHASNHTHIQEDAPKGCYDGAVVSDHPSQWVGRQPGRWDKVLGATDPLIMKSIYKSGCYCDAGTLANCQCKVECDRRSDCGVKAEQSRCTWCCEDADGAYWTGHTVADPWDLTTDKSPIGQVDTCRASGWKSGMEKRSLYDVLSISKVPIAESEQLCELRSGGGGALPRSG